MIAIARKRKQNSAYTTKGEARPVSGAGLEPLALSQLPLATKDLSVIQPVDLIISRVCVSKQFPPVLKS
jgi:hypothetical protein